MTVLVAFDPLSSMATIFSPPGRRGRPASPRVSPWIVGAIALGALSACNSCRSSDGGSDRATGGIAHTGGNGGATNDAGRAGSDGSGGAGGTSSAGSGGVIDGSGGASTSDASDGATQSGSSEGGRNTEAGGSAEAGPIVIQGAPFTTRAGLFDATRPADLGLPIAAGTETFTIFRPIDTTDHYGNGVALAAFQGWLYAQWQSSPVDEDTADTWTAYSRSQDGRTWTAPMTLAARSTDERASGGFWVAGDTLVAYINVYPTGLTPRGGYVEYTTSTDGLQWSDLKRLPMSDGSPMTGIFEQDPHALPGGRILNAAHFQPGLMVAPIYTDDPSGIAGWTRAPFPSLSNNMLTTREIEPSSYLRADGALVMVFRDQNSTFRKIASASADRGATWTTPVVTDMPDSRAKQSAGNLPDGTAYLVGNPVTTNTRIPLAVALSHDGKVFDKAFVLRQGGADLQAQRYTGRAKTLGYNYPKSMVWNGYLYVGYSTNKEDVEYTRVPLTSLGN